MSKRIKEETGLHEHLWSAVVSNGQQVCSCKCVLISTKEFDRRKAQWDIYYEKVRETIPYKRFIAQKKAMKENNLALVRAFAEKAREELKTKNDWLPTPPFPDDSWPKYRTVEGEEKRLEMLKMP